MAFTNFESKEINCKVIYFGANRSGKTENLRAIYRNTEAFEPEGASVGLSAEVSTPFCFGFLPVSMGVVRGFHLKLHLFTMPSTSLFKGVGDVVLKGLDGFIFVADSQIDKVAENIEAIVETKHLLLSRGYDIKALAKVFQYNKRDLQGTADIASLRAQLNDSGAPDLEATAIQSRGTLETLELVGKQILQKLAHISN